jgi:hypothetical protein
MFLRVSMSLRKYRRTQCCGACKTADTKKHLSGNGTTDIGYREHFNVTSMHRSYEPMSSYISRGTVIQNSLSPVLRTVGAAVTLMESMVAEVTPEFSGTAHHSCH